MLNKYQKRVFYRAGKRAGLFYKMRLGKTYITYALLKKYKAERILIIAPSSAFAGWKEVIKEKIICLYKKEKTDFRNKGFYLINKEGLNDRQYRGFIDQKNLFDAVILDESTFIKSPKSGVSKIVLSRFTYPEIKYVLTGTPSPESSLDFVNQLKFLDNTFPDYWVFRNKFCYNPFLYEFIPTAKGRELLNQYLDKYCFFKNRKAVNFGDVKKRKVIKINYSKKIKKRLNEIADKFISGKKELKYVIQVFSEMKKTASGYDEDFNLICNKKLNSLKKLIDNLKGKTIIFCDYKKDCEVISSVLNCEYISGKIDISKREDIIERFKNISYMNNLVYLQSTGRGGMGLNFSEAKNIIYYSQNPSYEIRRQSEDRAVKENKTVYIYDICTSFDKRIYNLRKRKLKQSEFYFKFFQNWN